MSTNRTFSAMLNDYLTYDLLKEEFIKRDYILSKVEKDDSWKGGNLVVPFKAAGASSVSFGQLTASTDVAEDKYVRGTISNQPEVWGTMLFNHRDLLEHDKVSEQNFLKILPDAVDDFMDYMKMAVCLNMTNGQYFAKVTTSGTNAGVIVVDRIERFSINQKVILQGTTQAAASYYVTGIDVNTSKATLSASRGGAVADVSAYTTGDAAKCYFDGSQTAANSLTSLKSSLLSATNGGSSTLYGQSKILYPFLQAINIDGSGVTAANVLDNIFSAFTTIRNVGKGNPTDVIMSYKHLGSIMKQLETQKGAYHVVQDSTKVNAYGWTEISVYTVKGVLKLVGVQELDNDYILFIDWRGIKLHSNGFFRKRVNPDGKEYYEVRATSGYYYLLDICFFGDLVVSRPSYCGIMYNISY